MNCVVWWFVWVGWWNDCFFSCLGLIECTLPTLNQISKVVLISLCNPPSFNQCERVEKWASQWFLPCWGANKFHCTQYNCSNFANQSTTCLSHFLGSKMWTTICPKVELWNEPQVFEYQKFDTITDTVSHKTVPMFWCILFLEFYPEIQSDVSTRKDWFL